MMELHIEAETPRLDRFLTERFPELPRSQWEIWIRAGNVRLNGVPATKPGTRLRVGDRVETEVPERVAPGAHLEPQDLGLPTLYEDDRLWVLDKPAGVVVHPGPGHADGTVVNALLHKLGKRSLEAEGAVAAEEDEDEEAPAPGWPGLVHRLDRYTTGCLVTTKDAEAQAHLQAQFKARSVDKRYLALCRQSRRLPEIGSLLVDAPLARHRLERQKMCVNNAGRSSQTRVRVLGRAAGLALVECELMTGRTHQIRVHLSHLGAPILGDPMYGGPTRWQDEEKRAIVSERPLLHAWRLSLDHPGTGERLSFEAPVPDPLRSLLDRLGLLALTGR